MNKIVYLIMMLGVMVGTINCFTVSEKISPGISVQNTVLENPGDDTEFTGKKLDKATIYIMTNDRVKYEGNIRVKSDEESGYDAYEVKTGDILEFSGLEEIKLEISRVSDEMIEIKTLQTMALENQNGSWNLNNTKTEFYLKKYDSLGLRTSTLDAGDCYYLEYR